MAQSLHNGLYGPFSNLSFGVCAIYFDLKALIYLSIYVIHSFILLMEEILHHLGCIKPVPSK